MALSEQTERRTEFGARKSQRDNCIGAARVLGERVEKQPSDLAIRWLGRSKKEVS